MEPVMPFEHASKVDTAIWAFFALFMIFVGLVVTVLLVWAYCRIFSKAGYCWALGLLMFVPIANIIMAFILAFGDWPISRELRLLKQQQKP